MKSSTEPPILGLTSILQNKAHKLAEIHDLFLNPKELARFFPEPYVITEQKANFTALLIEKEILMNLRGDKRIRFKMDTGCVIDSLPGDVHSPVLIEFYLLENNLFYRFGGRLRMRVIDNHIKVGIYIYDLLAKDALLDEIDFNTLKKIIRDELRALLLHINNSDLVRS